MCRRAHLLNALHPCAAVQPLSGQSPQTHTHVHTSPVCPPTPSVGSFGGSRTPTEMTYNINITVQSNALCRWLRCFMLFSGNKIYILLQLFSSHDKVDWRCEGILCSGTVLSLQVWRHDWIMAGSPAQEECYVCTNCSPHHTGKCYVNTNYFPCHTGRRCYVCKNYSSSHTGRSQISRQITERRRQQYLGFVPQDTWPYWSCSNGALCWCGGLAVEAPIKSFIYLTGSVLFSSVV